MERYARLMLPMLAIGTLAPAVPLAASVFQVFPVTIEASAEAPAGVVTLSNGSKEPIALQVRVFRWTQVGGQDVLTPTQDVVASPPAAKIEPGGRQLVRVVRVSSVPAASEEAYRLIIDELPVSKPAPTNGIRILLRQSIPVFLGSSPKASPRLTWRIGRVGDGWQLSAVNSGSRRQRISDLEVRDGAGKLLGRRPGLVGYVLPGSEAHWPVDVHEASAVPARLVAASDAGAVHADLAGASQP